MYAIKMNAEDKSLETTVEAKIYQYERNIDTLVFLIPRYYEETNMADCAVMMRYLLPSGAGKSEELVMSPLPYNKDYYKYHLKLTTRFTENIGDIELWLNIINLEGEVILKTGSVKLSISETKEITDYMVPEDLNQLDKLDAKIKLLEKFKADDITSNAEGTGVQLKSKGMPIGNAAKINPTTIVYPANEEVVLDPNIKSLSAVVHCLDAVTVRFQTGFITEKLLLCNGIRLEGDAVGFPQNYKQEVSV